MSSLLLHVYSHSGASVQAVFVGDLFQVDHRRVHRAAVVDHGRVWVRVELVALWGGVKVDPSLKLGFEFSMHGGTERGVGPRLWGLRRRSS